MSPSLSSRLEIQKLAALALAHGLVASAAHAQSSPAAEAPAKSADDDVITLDRVEVQSQQLRTVSSPKFTVPLVDTPQTISVIGSDIFNAQGATTLSDVLRNTPGITFAAGEGGSTAAGDSFFMRGFDASGSIFVDGVRDSGAYSRDTYALEQVEIAKGPAGADAGRGGSSGYLNLVTKTPSLRAASSANLTYGGAADGSAQQRAVLDVNRPLSASSAFRVAALWQDSGVPGRHYVNNSSWGVSPSLAFGHGTNTRVTVAASIDRIDNLPDSGLPVPALPGANLPGGTTFDVDQANFYGLPGQDYDRVDHDRVSARLDHDFSGTLRLVNQATWARTDRDAITSYFPNSGTTVTSFNPTASPVNLATGAVPASYVTFDPTTGFVTPRRIRNEVTNEIRSNQTHLTSQFETGRLVHSASVGLELSREEQTTPTWSPTGGVSTNLLAPDASRVATVAQTPFRAANLPYVKGRIDTAAIYAFDTIQINPRLLLNTSLRWETYEIDYASLAAATLAAPFPALSEITQRYDILSVKGGLVFKPTANGSLYVAYADTAIPPGSSFAFSTNATNANNPNLRPQKSRNYELGAKWEFLDRRLSTNLALYRSENLNIGSTDAVTGLVTQDISQTSQGVEFGVSGRLGHDVLIYGGVGYIDTSYNSGGTTAAEDDGASLRFTPRLSGNLWMTYAAARRLTVGGGLQYSESVVRSTSNTVANSATSVGEIPSYWLVNFIAAYAASDKVTLRLNLNNVFDKETYRLNNNGGRYFPGSPRTILLTSSLTF